MIQIIELKISAVIALVLYAMLLKLNFRMKI